MKFIKYNLFNNIFIFKLLKYFIIKKKKIINTKNIYFLFFYKLNYKFFIYFYELILTNFYLFFYTNLVN